MQEQLQLYLYTATYFLSYFEKPAWLACNIGDFLTQFFYLRGGGATILALLFLTEWLLLIAVCKKVKAGVLIVLLALFPVLMGWILHLELLYSVTYTVSIILLLGIFVGYIQVTARWWDMLLGVLFTGVLYWLVGSVSLLFPLLAVVWDVVNRKSRPLYWLGLVMLAIAIPFLLRGAFLLSMDQALLYPFLSVRQLPAVCLLGVWAVLLLFAPVRPLSLHPRSFMLIVVSLFVFLGGGLYWKANLKNEALYALSTESYFGNWDRVNSLVDKQPSQDNALMTYYINIALSRQHTLPERLMEFYQPAYLGMFLPVGPTSGWLSILFSSDVFYHVGDMNMAQHSAMLGSIFSPKHRSSRMVKRLAEINLANEDTTAAYKYLRMLDATLFHRHWAAEQITYLQGDSLEASYWLKAKRVQLSGYDTLRQASDYETSLKLLVQSHPENQAALDYLLCFYLLNKDIPSFVAAYNTWCKGKAEMIPKVYSEALLIYFAIQKTPEKEVRTYLISPEKMNDFMEYTRLYEENNGAIEPLQATYGTSYWFYYHFAQLSSNDE